MLLHFPCNTQELHLVNQFDISARILSLINDFYSLLFSISKMTFAKILIVVLIITRIPIATITTVFIVITLMTSKLIPIALSTNLSIIIAMMTIRPMLIVLNTNTLITIAMMTITLIFTILTSIIATKI